METMHASNSQQPMSVTQLNRLARTLLERDIGTVWLAGEISNFTRASSGHWYFTLKDNHAQIKAAMFRNSNRTVNITPREGDQVTVRASVGLYEPRGDYQLVVEKMAADGEGRLKQAFEELKQQLLAEGLFSAEHKRPLPDNIKRIGVITSASGAALHDVLTVLKRRNPSVSVIIYPSMVQGEQASQQLVNALNIANRRNEVDVLLLTRGGGSLEDLWCFNSAALARAIFASRLPIVSAIGHEVDVTIADFVADLRAPTPSAAAEILSEDRQVLLRQLETFNRQLQQAFAVQRKRADHQWQLLTQQLISAHPAKRLQTAQQTLDHLHLRLNNAMQTSAQRARQRLAQAALLLNSVSPLATLSRGYSITLKDDKPVSNAASLACGDKIHTRLHQGTVVSQVLTVHQASD